MKIVIVGAGEVGVQIAKQLTAEEKDVVIIEKDEEKAKRANDTLDCMVIRGEGSSREALIEAGISKADIFIAATSIDEVNMISCLVASSEYNIPIKVARVRNVEYSKIGLFSRTLVGIDYIVNPEVEAAYEIVEAVKLGASSGIFSFHGTSAQLRDLLIEKGSLLAGKSLKDIRLELRENFIVAGVFRNDTITVPKGDFVIEVGDHLYLVALGNTANRILTKVGKKTIKIRKVIVVGAGLIGRQVTELLLQEGRAVKLIEKDYERCKEISRQFQEVEVIHGDISDEDIFDEENLANSDAIVATTSNEEVNILAGLYAKFKGVERAISLINKTSYISLATSLGIDSCVSPKLSSVDAILKFIRKGNIKNVYTVFEKEAEAIEFTVNKNSKFDGKAVMDLHLPSNCLIVAIQRGNNTIIPSGSFIIKAGDSIINFVTLSMLKQFEDFIAE